MSGGNDESENQAEHPSERTGTNEWRVISGPARRLEPEDDELKTLIRKGSAHRARASALEG